MDRFRVKTANLNQNNQLKGLNRNFYKSVKIQELDGCIKIHIL